MAAFSGNFKYLNGNRHVTRNTSRFSASEIEPLGQSSLPKTYTFRNFKHGRADPFVQLLHRTSTVYAHVLLRFTLSPQKVEIMLQFLFHFALQFCPTIFNESLICLKKC
uniref:(northern house mosquito) hypothetical protein n=1 Tax=Culex pipiens TaxID=7175 RepID=A0A8D8FL11_CULPI